MSMYIITHKPYNDYTTDPNYKTLLVGSYKGHVCGDLYDDVGENISHKNGSFCELTGIYWLWKNSVDDYIGIVHYRRYFTHSFRGLPVITEEEIRRILQNYDIILPFKREYNTSIAKDFCKISGFQKDLDLLRDSIEKLYPDYLSFYNDVMNGNRTYLYNMFIVKKKEYDQYCKWLFDLLFDVEKKVDTTGYNDYQKRIYGFMSERLMTVWVLKNQFKVFEMGMLPVEERKSFFAKTIMGIKRSVKFKV